MREIKLFDVQGYHDEIEQAIAAGRDEVQLRDFLREYDDYTSVIEPLFSRFNNPGNNIFMFKVTYQWERLVVRTIEIHGNQNFNQLAKVIIKSMGWQNDHMHGFYLDKLEGQHLREAQHYCWFAPYWEDEPYPYVHTDKVKIAYFDWEKHPKIGMTFDYGDNHNFEIELLGSRPMVRHEKQTMFPRVIKQVGKARAQYPEIDEETGEYKNIYKNWFETRHWVRDN